MQKNKKNKKAAPPPPPVESSSSEEDSDSDSDDTSGASAKHQSSSSSSDEDSSDDETTSAPVKTVAKKVDSSDSSDSDDESSSDDDSDVDMKDGTSAPTSAKSAKRKADAVDSTSLPAKKVKVDGGVAAVVPADEETKTVFIGNLAFSTDDEQLKIEFSSFGEVVSARVPVDRNTGRARGIGYVEFADHASALAAVAASGKEIMGREVKIDLSAPRVPNPEKRAKAFNDETSPPSTVLFVGNLDFNCTEDGIWEAFGDFGEVVSVRLPTDRETQKPKGFGYVEFADQATAIKAFEGMRGKEILGRPVRLDYSQPRDNSGGRGGGRGFGGDRGGRGGGRGKSAIASICFKLHQIKSSLLRWVWGSWG